MKRRPRSPGRRPAAARGAAAPRPGRLRTVAGVALAPVAALAAFAAARTAEALVPCGDVRPFLLGMGAYAASHLLLYRPLFLHVVEHEFTHALFVTLSLGRVFAVHIDSDDKGSVSMSKQSALISLAPYFFPLFSVAALLVYGLSAPPWRPALAFAAGALFAFHALMTLRDLKVRQPDLESAGGRLFALPTAALAHAALFCACLYLLSHGEMEWADLFSY